MNIEFEVISRGKGYEEYVRKIFAEMLKEQGKVKGNLAEKASRCKLVCLAKVDGNTVAIGGVKEKTSSDFDQEKAAIAGLKDEFDWELGYMYTKREHCRKGIASYVARLLVEAHGDENLMASTEVSANSGMVKILERLGFRLFGKPWKSGIHGNYLGLFLKFK